MRRFLLLAIAAVCLAPIGASAQGGTLHGYGDPRTLTPVPNCAQSRFYVDDSTQKLYLAAIGSPCAWTDASAPGAGLLTFSVAAYGAKGDQRYSNNAVALSGSTTITCSDCAFVPGDAGKLVWVNPALPQTTIAAVNSSTSITVAAATTGAANNQLIIWGSDDTAALANAWAAANAVCGVVKIPAGRYITQLPQFNRVTNSACASTFLMYNLPEVAGEGYESTFIVPSPNFDFTGCATGDSASCFLGGQYSMYRDFAIYGGGQAPAGCANKILAADNGAFVMNMDFTSWCSGTTGSIGLKLLGPSSAALFGGVEAFGGTCINASGTNSQLNNFVGLFCSAAVLQVHDLNLVTFENAFGGPVIVDAGYTWNSKSDWLLNASSLVINGTANIDSLLFQATQSAPITLNAGGTLRPKHTSFPSVGGFWLNYAPESTLIDAEGGNTLSGATQVLPISNKQFGSVTANGVTSTVKAFTNTTQGSALIALIEWQAGGPTLSGCADTALNAYTQQGSTLTTGSTYGSARNIALVYTNGNLTPLAQDNLTCTFSASASFTVLAVAEYVGQFKNGVQSTSPFDGVTTNTGSGTAVTAGATTTTTLNNEMIGLFLSFNGIPTWTNTGTAQTVRANGSGFYVLSDAILSTAGTYALTGTLSVNADWGGFWFRIKPGTDSVVYGSASMLGTPQVSANWAVPAGASAGQWGTSPSVGSCKGSAVKQECLITVGSGTVGANPVLTITQPTSFIATPSCDARMVGGTATWVNFKNGTVTTSSASFTYNGTPAASSTIDLVVECTN